MSRHYESNLDIEAPHSAEESADKKPAPPERSGHPRYHFKPNEKIPHGVKRMVLEQIDEALERLGAKGEGIDEAIHDARVCFKKIRAVLRLVRGEMAARDFKSEYKTFRDAGRRLSAVRDSAVVVDTFDKLVSTTATPRDEDLQRLRGALVRAEKTPVADKEAALSEVAAVIRATRMGIEDWPIERKGFSALAPGLKQVYGAGKAVLKKAQEQPAAETLHELRKRVKDLRYQMHVLSRAWREMLDPFVGQLKELAGLLSEHHDLVVLLDAMSDVSASQSGGDPMRAILALILCRQDELRMQAMPLAERVYVENPAGFVRRIEGYWTASRP